MDPLPQQQAATAPLTAFWVESQWLVSLFAEKQRSCFCVDDGNYRPACWKPAVKVTYRTRFVCSDSRACGRDHKVRHLDKWRAQLAELGEGRLVVLGSQGLAGASVHPKGTVTTQGEDSGQVEETSQ